MGAPVDYAVVLAFVFFIALLRTLGLPWWAVFLTTVICAAMWFGITVLFIHQLIKFR